MQFQLRLAAFPPAALIHPLTVYLMVSALSLLSEDGPRVVFRGDGAANQEIEEITAYAQA
jgi:hypothetical protein